MCVQRQMLGFFTRSNEFVLKLLKLLHYNGKHIEIDFDNVRSEELLIK